MNILITVQPGKMRDIYFPKQAVENLDQLGQVSWNDADRPMTEEELTHQIKKVDICTPTGIVLGLLRTCLTTPPIWE